MSWGRFHLHQGSSRSGMRPLGRCSAQKPAPCNVVVIDEDDDASDSEVFIIDGAALGKAAPAAPGYQTKKGNGSSADVIDIDDEEDEGVEEHTGRGDKAGPSTSRDAGSPESTTPGRGSPRNRYGLDCTSDSYDSDSSEGWTSDSDDGGSSDCEILDDTSGTARETWEMAASRKKMPHGIHEFKDGRATASTSNAGSGTQSDKNAEDLFGAECHLDENIFWYFTDAWKGGKNSTGCAKDGHGPSSVPNAKECSHGNVSNGQETECEQNSNGSTKDGPAECCLNENIFQCFSDAWKGGQNSTGYAKDGDGPSSVPNAKECSNRQETECVQNRNGSTKDGPAECHLNENIFQCFSDMNKEGAQNCTGGPKYRHSPSSVPNANKCPNGNVSDGKETKCRARLDPDTPCNDKTAHSHSGVVPEDAPEGIQSPHLDETFFHSFVSANGVFPTRFSADQKDGSPPISVSTPEKTDEKIPEGAYSQKDQSPPHAHNISNKDKDSAQDSSVSGQQAEVPPFTSRCYCSRQFGENGPQVQANSCACAAASIKNTSVNFTLGSCTLPQKDLVDDHEELGQSTLVQDAFDFQDGLIGEREKHKESVEYKRAEEEEWASRQRQLQIQAEEAKKLRKRKKAEAQRLLDMEKRQKQRLQEVRESQRKIEEDIQLKEQYRGIVRKELEDTERRYRDMASILRVLGIPVEGVEVKAAYKQALLKFHPDRVSRNDIYQQVKAEETFKFISRLKEKLPRFL